MIKIDLTPKMWVYHRKESPKGKIVTVDEAQDYLKKGWVKTPADFPKSQKKQATETQKEEKESGVEEDVPHETIPPDEEATL